MRRYCKARGYNSIDMCGTDENSACAQVLQGTRLQLCLHLRHR